MDKEQTAKVLSYLRTSYTLNPGTNANAVINVWHDFFKDIPFEVVFNATKEFMINDKNHNYNQFPCVGQIMDIIKEWHKKTLKTPEEAWKKVSIAIGNGRSNSKGEFENLSKDIQSALGNSNVIREMADAGSYEKAKFKEAFLEKYNQVLEKTALNMARTGAPLIESSTQDRPLLK